jgi:hypothetical protein
MSDRLLYSMSARERLPIEQFNVMFGAVCEQSQAAVREIESNNPRRQAVRLLDSLGHCEFDFDSRHVWTCPPALVLLPSYGLPKAVLTGARSPALIGKLKQAVGKRRAKAVLHIIPLRTSGIQLPALVTIEAMDVETIETIAMESGVAADIKVPAAWRMVNFSSGLDEIKAAATFIDRADINWQSSLFVPQRLTFVPKAARDPAQLQLVAYKNRIDQQIKHWIWDGTRAAETDRDWGRYLALAAFNFNVLLYDDRRHRLAAPLTVPLPCLLARALVLCTGKVPLTALIGQIPIGAVPPGHPMQIYEGVTPAISACVARKAGQTLIPAGLEPNENGVINA